MDTGIRCLHHVGLSVPDLAAAKAFYVGVLGMRLINSRPWHIGDSRMDEILGLSGSSGERALLEGLQCRIELWHFQTPPAKSATAARAVSDQGITHLCFEVDNLVQVHRQLSGAGVEFVSMPSRSATGSVAVYARDPFGNYLEFFEPPSGRTDPP